VLPGAPEDCVQQGIESPLFSSRCLAF
jgi:hypothetical protein